MTRRQFSMKFKEEVIVGGEKNKDYWRQLSETACWNINTEKSLPLMGIIILLLPQSAFQLCMRPRSLTWINFSWPFNSLSVSACEKLTLKKEDRCKPKWTWSSCTTQSVDTVLNVLHHSPKWKGPLTTLCHGNTSVCFIFDLFCCCFLFFSFLITCQVISRIRAHR